jgi:hypothetical protein
MDGSCSMRRSEENIEFWIEKPKGKRPVGRCRRIWAENIKMDLRQILWGLDSIHVIYDRD